MRKTAISIVLPAPFILNVEYLIIFRTGLKSKYTLCAIMRFFLINFKLFDFSS